MHLFKLVEYNFTEVIIMRSCELVAFVTAAACTIAQCYPEEELPVLAAVFTQLGDTLSTIMAQEEACKDVAE